jgi:hypothetical protein
MQQLIKSAGACVCGDFVLIGNDQRRPIPSAARRALDKIKLKNVVPYTKLLKLA